MGFENDANLPQQAASGVSPRPPLLPQIVNDILQTEIEKALPLIQHYFSAVTPQKAGAEYETIQSVLKSLWEYYEALRLVRQNSEFQEAGKLFQSAAAGFEKAGQAELRDLAAAMSAYTQATIEFYNYNIKHALDLFKMVKEYLQKAGKYGSRFQSLIDHMEPDALFAAGANAVMAGDFENAGIMIEKASAASGKLAETYYKPEDPFYKSFKGMSFYHKAYFEFFSALHDLNCFKYDRITPLESISANGREAKKLLDQGDQNSIFRAQTALAEAFAELLETVQGLAKVMQSLLRSSFKQDVTVLEKLRSKTARARELISKAGPQTLPLLRLCNDLTEKADNIERLAKPGKKDFGAYSGLISCALFLPLFLIISWANTRFAVGLEANRLILSAVGLALIGGFGVAALKFKGLFWGK